jgi:hypothetical protein
MYKFVNPLIHHSAPSIISISYQNKNKRKEKIGKGKEKKRHKNKKYYRQASRLGRSIFEICSLNMNPPVLPRGGLSHP